MRRPKGRIPKQTLFHNLAITEDPIKNLPKYYLTNNTSFHKMTYGKKQELQGV